MMNLVLIRRKYIWYLTILLLLLFYSCGSVSPVSSLSSISVPEEGGINFVRITEDADNVAIPTVTGNTNFGSITQRFLSWWINPMLAISPDGKNIAYIAEKNKLRNVMVKSSERAGASTQRTFRNFVADVSWSPDGKNRLYNE